MKAYRIFSYLYVLTVLTEVILLVFSPFGVPFKPSFAQLLYMLILFLYLFKLAIYPAGKAKRRLFLIFKFPEFTFVFSLSFFLFSYIYASNANMDYVQRFMQMGGKLNLAIDSRMERSISAMQFAPLLILNLIEIVYMRIRYSTLSSRLMGKDIFSKWGLFWTFLSVILFSFSFPSFLKLDGIALFAWISIVPLLLVIEKSSYLRGVFYGTSFGVLEVMITNYWLGTFQLISLQFVTFFFLIYYLVFMFVTIRMYRLVKEAKGLLGSLSFLVFPLAWLFFDYLHSIGFLGYPWGMLGVTQYSFLSLIQISSVTGVWGVTFIVLLANSVIAMLIREFSFGTNVPVKRWTAIGLFVVIFGSAMIYGYVTGGKYQYRDENWRGEKVKVALVQQNTDPRKNDYEDTLEKLKALTDEAIREKPDIVVWSETAFVPNIRRWSKLDPEKYPLAKLVREFLRYQKSLGVWLLTGNDDYLIFRKNGKEERYDYNASVLFSPEGKRVKTYHKIKLVPFTEYFPYKKQLPSVYQLLKNFDVYLWEPGTERVVFRHPKFNFSTPICFEDAFPDEIRQFVLAGADAIVNISNDYWSLTRVEAKQHFINAIFRAVENRRPLLRATASGVTAYVNTTGRVVKEAPYYEEAYLVVDVPIEKNGFTLYTMYGDWFPLTAAILLLVLSAWALFAGIRRRDDR